MINNGSDDFLPVSKTGRFFLPAYLFFKRKYSIIKVQKITDSGEKGGKPYGGEIRLSKSFIETELPQATSPYMCRFI